MNCSAARTTAASAGEGYSEIVVTVITHTLVFNVVGTASRGSNALYLNTGTF